MLPLKYDTVLVAKWQKKFCLYRTRYFEQQVYTLEIDQAEINVHVHISGTRCLGNPNLTIKTT